METMFRFLLITQSVYWVGAFIALDVFWLLPDDQDLGYGLRFGYSFIIFIAYTVLMPIWDSIERVSDPDDCEHEWVDARNQAVKSGEYCAKCGTLRAGNQEAVT